MDAIIDNLSDILKGFQNTILLTLSAAVLATVLGTIVATMRVSPIQTLRELGATYVNIVRNTPLAVLFFMVVFGLPELGITLPFFVFAIGSLGIYTSAFVAEVLRSGLESVPVGQAEATRSLGLGFGHLLTKVLLPQAARNVVAPLGNVYIACIKNSSVAMAFGVFEATSAAYTLANAHGTAVMLILASVAIGYLILTTIASGVTEFIERRVRIVT